ncbi:MAG: DUF2490 domain-containing protein [Cyclobacteriaceae bacterium]
MKSFLLTLIFFLSFLKGSFAQKQIETREQTWFGYFNQTRFTDRSGVWMDLQLRLNDVVNKKSASILRLGYTYFVSDQLRLTAGYGYITHYSLSDQLPDVPENRPWQQIQWFDKKKSVSFAQYFRVEERFVRKVSNGDLTDDFLFNWRFRYNIAASIPLKGREISPKTPFLFLNNELHVNAGKNIVNNYFDQNRLFAGLGYQFTAGLNTQLGYLYVFQQLPSGDHYVHINAIRLFVFHNLNFRSE